LIDAVKLRKIPYSPLLFFFIAGLCEIGGGYLVWLWLREDMSWILGVIGGFVCTYSYFIWYCTYSSTFLLSQNLRCLRRSLYCYGSGMGLLFERVIPDFYDILGAVIAIIGVVIIFYVPRKGEEALWQR
jgi:small multidrug resistance family-3 protein